MPPPKKKKRIFPSLPPKLGVAAQFITDCYDSVPGTLADMKNGHVLFIYISTRPRDVNKTCANLRERINSNCSASELYYAVKKLVRETFDKHRTHTDARQMEHLTEVCAQDFMPCLMSPPIAVQIPSVENLPIPSASAETAIPVNRAETVPLSAPCAENAPTLAETAGPTISRSPVKTRRTAHCRNCNILRKSLRKCIQEKNELKISVVSIGGTRRKRKVVPKNSSKSLNAKLNRRDHTIKRLKRKLADSELIQLKNELAKLKKCKTENQQKVGSLKEQLKIANKDKIKCLKELETDYQNKILILKEEIESLKSDCSHVDDLKKEGKMYNHKVRLIVYDCLMANVPTGKVSDLILSLSKRFGAALSKKDVPVRSSIENMAIELGLMSDLQVAEVMYTTPNITLGFDATTQEGTHVNAIHTTTPDECFVVALDQLAGGTAQDYADHVVNSVEHLSEVYTEFHPEAEWTQVKSQLVGHISCTITDRAAVNHAAVRIVNETFGTTLLEVNCHLHPLDTIASKARSTLLSHETNKGKLFGTGCLAERVVLALNKMRFKDSKGDPHGFRVFLRDHNLPQSLIIRYRGNRLHVLFKLAAVYIVYYEQIKLYLTSRCLNNSGLKTGLIHDFELPTTYMELKVLAVLGKLLTGPWMKRFYINQEKGLHQMDAFNDIKACYARVEQLSTSDVIHVNLLKEDFFGDPIVQNPSEHAIWEEDVDVSAFTDLIKAVLVVILEVIKRQYQHYYEMEKDIDDTMREKLSSARTHNMDSEELMGMFSANQERAPRATLLYVSSKIRAKKNKTLDYLAHHPDAQSIVERSVSAAVKLRQRTRKSVVELEQEMSRRVITKMNKRDQLSRKKLEKQLDTIMNSENPDFAGTFTTLDSGSVSVLQDILNGSVVGHKIVHNWSEAESHVPTPYFGKVEKLKVSKAKKNPKKHYVICYWDSNGTYDEDGEDYKLELQQFAVDFILGDVRFIS